MKVVNIYGCPSAGKSVYSAGLYSYLKRRSHSVELVREYARELISAGHLSKLENQLLVAGTQLQRIRDLRGKFDYVISDSPILLSLVYCRPEVGIGLGPVLIGEERAFSTINLLLAKPDYVQQDAGRMHTIADVDGIHDKIVGILQGYGLPYFEITRDTPFDEIEDML